MLHHLFHHRRGIGSIRIAISDVVSIFSYSFILPIKFHYEFNVLLKSNIERFPFDWKNPIGYSVAINLQLVMFSFPLSFIAYTLGLSFGAFIFGLAFVKDVKYTIKSLEKFVKTKPQRSAILRKVIELIRFPNSKR